TEHLIASDALLVGQGVGGDGEILISGTGKGFSGEVRVGVQGGTGLVTIDGPQTYLKAGRFANGSGEANLPGDLIVGESGTGALVVENGGKALVEGDFTLGRHALGEAGAL